MCVCIFFFFFTFDKTVLEEKAIRCPRKSIFCYFASFFISGKYIIVSVILVKSIQGDLTESRSLNWERIARDQKAVISFSYLSACFCSFNRLSIFETVLAAL